MPASARAMVWCTVGCLVAVSAYSAALGANGWLWLAWVTLALCTVGVLAARGPR